MDVPDLEEVWDWCRSLPTLEAFAIVDKGLVADEASYTVAISNGRLTERAEFRLSPQVMRTLARGADAPNDEQVRREIAQQVRSDNWAKIKKRAATPTQLHWMAHPS